MGVGVGAATMAANVFAIVDPHNEEWQELRAWVPAIGLAVTDPPRQKFGPWGVALVLCLQSLWWVKASAGYVCCFKLARDRELAGCVVMLWVRGRLEREPKTRGRKAHQRRGSHQRRSNAVLTIAGPLAGI